MSYQTSFVFDEKSLEDFLFDNDIHDEDSRTDLLNDNINNNRVSPKRQQHFQDPFLTPLEQGAQTFCDPESSSPLSMEVLKKRKIYLKPQDNSQQQQQQQQQFAQHLQKNRSNPSNYRSYHDNNRNDSEKYSKQQKLHLQYIKQLEYYRKLEVREVSVTEKSHRLQQQQQQQQHQQQQQRGPRQHNAEFLQSPQHDMQARRPFFTSGTFSGNFNFNPFLGDSVSDDRAPFSSVFPFAPINSISDYFTFNHSSNEGCGNNSVVSHNTQQFAETKARQQSLSRAASCRSLWAHAFVSSASMSVEQIQETNLRSKFEIVTQPVELQRKSYPHENRCIQPSPLTLKQKDNIGRVKDGGVFLESFRAKILGAVATAKLVTEYGRELQSVNLLMSVDGSAPISDFNPTDNKANLCLKISQTSAGKKLRLLFEVKYRVQVGNDTEEFVDKIYSDPFVVLSNKGSQNKKV